MAARAYRCEYCQLEERDSVFIHEVEHIIARKHQGETSLENLCFSCTACNRYKGANIAGIDPDTGILTRLYHPRVDSWDDHFHWDGVRLTGLTEIGRTTIAVLRINDFARVGHRKLVARRAR